MMAAIATLDQSVLEWLYALRDPSTVQFFIAFSELGSAITIIGVSICVVLLLIRKRHFSYASGFSIAIATAGLTTLLLKGLVARARPPIEFQAYSEVWFSFPSAHAAMSTAFATSIVFLAWHLSARASVRWLTLLVALLYVVIIMYTRLYLGVHYLSDVLMGALVGIAAAWIGARFTIFAAKKI